MIFFFLDFVSFFQLKLVSSIYFIVGFLIIALVVLSFFTHVQYKKSQQILLEQNEIINCKNYELEKTKCKLQQSINERDELLKEVQHRVKNNLQLIVSLLNIQARQTNNPEVIQFMKKGHTRISSMAIIHESLYHSEDKKSTVDLNKYINELVQSVSESYYNTSDKVDFEVFSQMVYLSMQSAIPLGLIVIELLCNVLDDSELEPNKGKVAIQIHKLEETVEMIFTDSTTKRENIFKQKKTTSLKLVKLLLKQIKGVVDTKNNHALQYIFTFPSR